MPRLKSLNRNGHQSLAQWCSDRLKVRLDVDAATWADGKLKLPQSVRYPVFIGEEAPWLLEILRAMSDPAISRVDVRMPAGSAKTLLGEIHIAWAIDNEPGTYYYVWQTDDDAKDQMEDRIYPMLEGNRVLMDRMPTDRHKKRMQKVLFLNMSLYAVGANLSAAQTKRVRYLTMEEPHLYKPGMMTAFEKRTEAVNGAKIITLSTGSLVDDESDKSFNEGSCEEWEVQCPFCKEYQAMTDSKDRLKANHDPTTHDDQGNIIWHKLLPTVRYNCEHCGMDWPNNAEFRREQSQGGRYRRTNSNAKSDHRSFHLEAASVHWITLESVLEEKLKASSAAKKGQLELLKDYIQKRRAMAWDDAPQGNEDFDRKRLEGGYEMGSAHELEISRFMTVDNQAGRARIGEGAHRWVVIRSYAEMESRLVYAGRVDTWEEVEACRIRHQVEPVRTLVDVAFDTQSVYAVLAKYGWQGLWGDNTSKKSFPHKISQPGQPPKFRQLPFSTVQIGHVGLGHQGTLKKALYYFWCKAPIQTLYQNLINGLTTYKWSHASNTPDEYFKHRENEFKRQSVDAAGNKKWLWARNPNKPDHLLDADQMNLIASMMDNRIRPVLYSFLDEVTNVRDASGENGS